MVERKRPLNIAREMFLAHMSSHGFTQTPTTEGGARIQALVRDGEVCLAVIPKWTMRLGDINLVSRFALFSPEYEASVGCVAFSACCLETFQAHSANFRVLAEVSWIHLERLAEHTERASSTYSAVATAIPNDRKAVGAAIASGSIGGLDVKHFLGDRRKRAEFLAWLSINT